MSEELDPHKIAGQIEALLDDIGAHSDPAVHAAAGSLVRLLMRFYGGGLEQILTIVRLGSGDTMIHRLAADPTVSGILALHDLHPVDMPTRVKYAMDTAKRRLGTHGDDVELLGIQTDGAIRVRISGSGCGVATVREVVETALRDAAPEAAGIVFEEAQAGPTLLQIGLRPPATATP